MTAQEAYDDWKRLHKLDLSVKTDFQMFEIAYNMQQARIDELVALILDMEKEIKKLKVKPKVKSK